MRHVPLHAPSRTEAFTKILHSWQTEIMLRGLYYSAPEEEPLTVGLSMNFLAVGVVASRNLQ